MNIPIYRAKKIDSDDWVEGYLTNDFWIGIDQRDYTIYNVQKEKSYRIDIGTLAIHFTNMIDKNGKKIFASLSEDGVGGDIRDSNWVIFYSDGCIKHRSLDDELEHISNYRIFKDFEVIGIHKG